MRYAWHVPIADQLQTSSSMGIEQLVPIRLDISLGQQQYQDTFCWSSEATQEEAQSFAATLCQDNQLPSASVPAIVYAIQQQVSSAQNCVASSSSEVQSERVEIIR